MKCHQIENKLSAYQDGELSASESELVERHLAVCNACREQHVKLQQMWKNLGKMPEIRPTQGFYDRVSARISEASKYNGFGFFDWRHRRFRTLLSPVAVSFLLAIGILCGALIGNSFINIHSSYSATLHAEEGLLSSLRVFTPVPPGTLADNYERLLSYNESHIR